ncbi:TPA: hypothetical protein ACGOBG_002342, partial [Streptococcus agalactiae]
DMTVVDKIFRGDKWFIPKPKISYTKPMNIIVFSKQERFDLFLFEAHNFDEVFKQFEEEKFKPYKYTAWASIDETIIKLFNF